MLIALGIFAILYIAYFIGANKLRNYKMYGIFLNSVSIVLCLVLIFDAFNKGNDAFILVLLLLLGIAVKRLINGNKKRGVI